MGATHFYCVCIYKTILMYIHSLRFVYTLFTICIYIFYNLYIQKLFLVYTSTKIEIFIIYTYSRFILKWYIQK